MVAVAPGMAGRWARIRSGLAIGAFWVAGSAIVAIAQPTSDRRLAGAATAAAGIATILVLTALTRDPGRRYFRSLVGAIVTVSVISSWLVRRLVPPMTDFATAGVVERIAIPLMVVLLFPLVVQALGRRLGPPRELWAGRATFRRSLRPMDWIFIVYAIVVTVPALALGLAHQNRPVNVAQDLGLVVLFVFMYLAGRTVDADTGRRSAEELIDVLLWLFAARLLLFHWPEIEPLFTYVEAACAGALAFVLLRPQRTRVLTLGLAVTLLAVEGELVRNGAGSSIAVDLAVALGLVAYIAVRIRRLVPQWLIVGATIVGVVGFIGFTPDGAALRGQYHGPDASNLGRTYEAQLVRKTVRQSPLSLVLGRGFGGTLDETGAAPLWKAALLSGGRDLAHVQEIHPLPYLFLLKAGFLGLAWFFAFVLGLAVLGFRALERAARNRDPSLVVYIALPVIGLIQAFAAATHLESNPLNGLAVGILVTALAAPAAAGQLPGRRAAARSSAAS